MTTMPPRTTVVVVTWRGRHLIGGCLDALATQTVAHELIVVDNASADGTAAVLARHPSAPQVLRLPANAGYAGALAAALPLVRTPYLGWLNDDAQPHRAWLEELESTLDADPGAAAAASLLLTADGRVQSTGVRLTADGHGSDIADLDAAFGFCGGAALLRTDALRAAGGVPAEFFCYYEDLETAWRLRLAGHDVRQVPSARVRHEHGGSGAHGSPMFHRWNERNRLLTLLRCAPTRVAAVQLSRFAVITVVLGVKRLAGRRPATANHDVLLRLRVLADVGGRLPATLRQRFAIGRRAVIARRDVWRTWAGR